MANSNDLGQIVGDAWSGRWLPAQKCLGAPSPPLPERGCSPLVAEGGGHIPGNGCGWSGQPRSNTDLAFVVGALATGPRGQHSTQEAEGHIVRLIPRAKG